MSLRSQIVALMQQRAARRVCQERNGRWHLTEAGEVDGDTVRAMIADGTLTPDAPGGSSYTLRHCPCDGAPTHREEGAS